MQHVNATLVLLHPLDFLRALWHIVSVREDFDRGSNSNRSASDWRDEAPAMLGRYDTSIGTELV